MPERPTGTHQAVKTIGLPAVPDLATTSQAARLRVAKRSISIISHARDMWRFACTATWLNTDNWCGPPWWVEPPLAVNLWNELFLILTCRDLRF